MDEPKVSAGAAYMIFPLSPLCIGVTSATPSLTWVCLTNVHVATKSSPRRLSIALFSHLPTNQTQGMSVTRTGAATGVAGAGVAERRGVRV